MTRLTGYIFILLIGGIVCPPPMRQQAEAQNAQQQAAVPEAAPSSSTQHPPQETPKPAEERKPDYEFAYTKYLEEVVRILETDPKFAERLKTMNEDDIKAGKIADHIDDLDQSVFDKLHKAKFAELERLKQQIGEQIKADGGAHNVKMPEHLDVYKNDGFHKEDLRKLIIKTVSDMNEIDERRKEDFKKYEMQKKAEQDHQNAQLNKDERVKAQHEQEEAEKRHNEHEKLKHPGSRDQLQEVWEESDHLEKDTFDPRTFFALHDLNGDGFWSDVELESLFQLELEKMYNETNPDDDPRERMEEMYRMREHVSKQMDKNGDRLISLDEFLADTEAQTPNKDEGWKDLGQEQIYTDEELQAFEREYAEKQGWGENAYQGAEIVIPPAGSEHHDQQQQQQQYQQQQQQQQVHPAVPPVQPVQPVQPIVNQQPPVPQQAAQPIHHAPIQDHQKDPTYGI
ncbi:unnamed protein product [Caenorhabditis angaria]|uniref:NUCB1-like N-terminal domain-containing protein n=1 Tax=Caenorhabditis angaria TaxID=860376 RepID=A0A9P1J308_9PELO|nr:unnamed protein product [Caenorhabditis angaria]